MRGNSQPINRPAFDVLWELAAADLAKPAVLHCESPGDTFDERGRVVREAMVQLRASGLVGPRGVSDEAAAVLRAVGRPQLAVDVRLFERVPVDERNPSGLTKLGARVAVSGVQGAVAVLGSREFRAWSFPRATLVNEVMALFEQHEPPARFAGVTLFPEQLRQPARRATTEATLALMAGPFLRRAYLCAVARDHVVGRVRVSAGLTLNDVNAGRYLVFTDRNQLVIAPGNRVTLERKLKEMTEFHRPY